MRLLLVLCVTLAMATSFARGSPTSFASCLADLPSQRRNALDRIYLGEDETSKGVPYIVKLEIFNGTDTFSCGGSIIAHNWILTAAHCVEDDTVYVTIFYGLTDRNNPQLKQVVTPEHVTLHPKYNNVTHIHDIALIRTPGVQFIENIQSIPLPKPGVDYNQKWARTSGWGETFNNSDVSSILQTTCLQVIPNAACGIGENELCVHTPKSSPCYGDSGGPLVLRNNNDYTVIGVASTVFRKFCGTHPKAVYTRVSQYLQWIKEVSGVV